MPPKEGMCRTCCRGVYSCHWSRRNDGRRRCTCCWFSAVAMVSLLAASWLYVCMMAFNDRDDFNWKAFESLKRWVNWFMVMVAVYAAIAIYCCLLLLFALFQEAMRDPVDPHCVHKVFLSLAVLLITAGIVGMSCRWADEWHTVYLSLLATGPFLQLGGVVALTVLCGFVFQRFFKAKRAVSKTIIMATFVVLTAAVFLSPLFIKSPCLLEVLPAKPALIGHRGAPMLAPENTMMSFRRSADCGVDTFETDVLISKDGTPFLMHDTTLQRTTDVSEKFPDRANHTSTSFTWMELQSLNAGRWFLKSNPFRTLSLLSERERAAAGNQSIPSLAELLELAKERNASLIFDMKDGDSAGDDTRLVVDTILKSGIRRELVLWLPPKHRAHAQTRGFRQIYSNVSAMLSDGGNLLNLKYNSVSTEELRELKRKNVTVNMWVVNDRWLFSLLWCAGVDSVTTNACHDLQKMDRPDWHLTPSTYRIIWISVDVASLVIMLIVFYMQRRTRERIFCPRDRGTPLLEL
ncbi:glycerophosphoinositol inositolphosphodiesterase GDPD2 [Scleropages formosus]|uniref:Glycerophosphodiester phosphodiesterase domain containing 2 n=1 Tax=Scleropages formosus TaxID=113540 RepID=A0A8C9R275_SCLFO|nr:glycerophosphoinositol inositolphosphodiesterase GDPD2 [Scleropages formosus]